MRRSSSLAVVILLMLLTTAALAHVTFALSSPRDFGDGPSVVQAVREHYAVLNSFLRTGDQSDLQAIAVPGEPFRGVAERLEWLGALRSTYPRVQLQIMGISSADGSAMARVVATGGEAVLPFWINGGAGLPLESWVDLLRIDRGRVVDWTMLARTGALAQTVAGSGTDFRVQQASYLTAMELVVRSEDSGNGFVSVSGPAIVVPVDGAVRLTGNDSVAIAAPLRGTKAVIAVDDDVELSGGSLLIVPEDRILLRADRIDARLVVLSLLPVHPEQRNSEVGGREDNPETLEDVMRRLSPSDEPEPIWFGTIRMLAVDRETIPAGAATMDLTRFVVPPMETVRLDTRGHRMLTIGTDDRPASDPSREPATNESTSIWTFDVVRVRWS